MIDPNAQTIKTYDKIAKEYAASSERYGRLNLLELETFISLLPENGSILDLGCGSGRDCEYFAQRGYEVVGVDLSERLLEQAKLLHPKIDFRVMDMRVVAFPDNNFDRVWASACLHHLQKADAMKVVDQIYRVLKLSGVVHILVHEGEGEKYIREEKTLDKPRYYSYFSAPELERCLTERKFEVLKSYIFNRQDRLPDSRDIDWAVVFARKN